MEKINFQDLPSTSTPFNSTNLNQMQDNMEDAIIPIKLVNIGVETPSTATTGDMFYNTTDNKIYTAIATNTWDSGSTPRYDGFYVNTSDNTLFYYNGTTLVGAGGSQTSINVKNEKTTSATDVYSCNYINNNNAFESGSNDLGNYIKYSDGTMIQYQRYATTVNIGGPWGSLFFGSISCPDYPQPFVNTEPTVTATVYPTTENWCLGNLVYSSDKPQSLVSAGTIMCVRASTITNLPIIVEIIAIGRWK